MSGGDDILKKPFGCEEPWKKIAKSTWFAGSLFGRSVTFEYEHCEVLCKAVPAIPALLKNFMARRRL